jgi:hypothetical protein
MKKGGGTGMAFTKILGKNQWGDKWVRGNGLWEIGGLS